MKKETMGQEQAIKKTERGGRRPNTGGARIGAGRKSESTNGIPKIRYGMRLRSDVVEILRSMKNATVFVESAVLEFQKKENKI